MTGPSDATMVAQNAPAVAPPAPSVPRPLLAKLARGLTRRLALHANLFAMRRSLAAVGLKHAGSIPTHTSPEELAALFDLTLGYPPGAAALEIGSYLGASACYLAAGLAHAGGTLTCIDTWQNQTMPEGDRDTFAEFQKNLAPVRDRLILIRKPTELLKPSDLGGPFHLAFIDGDHSYEAVKRDFELVEPCMAPNATIAMHDVLHHRGVTQLVGEVIAAGVWTAERRVNNLIWLHRKSA